MAITLKEAIELILKKKEAEAQKHLKKFEEEPDLEILNGRYGPYICLLYTSWFKTLRNTSRKYVTDCTYYLSYIRYTPVSYTHLP